jgi:hypothetical protein
MYQTFVSPKYIQNKYGGPFYDTLQGRNIRQRLEPTPGGTYQVDRYVDGWHR